MDRKLLNQCIVLLLSTLSCTKEIPEPKFTIDDLTGYWNGYYYRDLKGQVPLEVIRIDKHGSDSLVATKIVGDNAVLSGMTTWAGKYTGSTFPVMIQLGNGSDFDYFPAKVTVKSAVHLECDYGTVYIRRSDEYHP